MARSVSCRRAAPPAATRQAARAGAATMDKKARDAAARAAELKEQLAAAEAEAAVAEAYLRGFVGTASALPNGQPNRLAPLWPPSQSQAVGTMLWLAWGPQRPKKGYSGA